MKHDDNWRTTWNASQFFSYSDIFISHSLQCPFYLVYTIFMSAHLPFFISSSLIISFFCFSASFVLFCNRNCPGARRQTKAQTIKRSIRIGATNSKSTSQQWNHGRRNKWYVLFDECFWKRMCSFSMHSGRVVDVHVLNAYLICPLQQCSARQNFSNQHPNDIIAGNANVWPVGEY